MKNLLFLFVFFAFLGITSNAFAQEKSVKTKSKIKVIGTEAPTGKDDNCYLNGGTAPSDSTKTSPSTSTTSTTTIPVSNAVVDEGKKKVKSAGKSFLKNAGAKIKFP